MCIWLWLWGISWCGGGYGCVRLGEVSQAVRSGGSDRPMDAGSRASRTASPQQIVTAHRRRCASHTRTSVRCPARSLARRGNRLARRSSGSLHASAGNVAEVEQSDLSAEEAAEFGALVGALIGLGAEGEEGVLAGAEAGAAMAAENGSLHSEGVWFLADAIPEGTNDVPRSLRQAMCEAVTSPWPPGLTPM